MPEANVRRRAWAVPSRRPDTHRLKTCATAKTQTQVDNLCYERQRGAARAREPALLVERSHDGEARAASSEREAGWPERGRPATGMGSPAREVAQEGTQVDNLCYSQDTGHRLTTCATSGRRGPVQHRYAAARCRGGASLKSAKRSSAVSPADAGSPACERIVSERSRLRRSTSSIRSSIVSTERNRVTVTAPAAPMR